MLMTLPMTAAIGQGVVLSVAKELIAESPGEVGIGITAGPADALPRNSYIRIRGLPPSVALSQGHSIAPGSWAVPLSALPGLKLMLPTGVSGRSEVAVVLMSVDGAVQAEARSTLVAMPKTAASTVAAPPAPVARATTLPELRAGLASSAEAPPAVQPPAPVAAVRPQVAALPVPAAPTAGPENLQRLMRIVQKGDQELADGGIAGARLLYQRAADAGLAQGALALGGTYDPAELARARVVGIKADPAQARRWYERARELGAPEAAERLKRLGGP